MSGIIFPREAHSHTEVFIKFERQVPGLRSSGRAGPCKVYKANPDGTPGELLRIEKGVVYEQLLKDNHPRVS